MAFDFRFDFSSLCWLPGQNKQRNKRHSSINERSIVQYYWPEGILRLMVLMVFYFTDFQGDYILFIGEKIIVNLRYIENVL